MEFVKPKFKGPKQYVMELLPWINEQTEIYFLSVNKEHLSGHEIRYLAALPARVLRETFSILYLGLPDPQYGQVVRAHDNAFHFFVKIGGESRHVEIRDSVKKLEAVFGPKNLCEFFEVQEIVKCFEWVRHVGQGLQFGADDFPMRGESLRVLDLKMIRQCLRADNPSWVTMSVFHTMAEEALMRPRPEGERKLIEMCLALVNPGKGQGC